MAGRGTIACTVVSAVIISMLFAAFVWNPFVIPPIVDDDTTTTVPPGTELSKFSFPLFAEDTRTATASMIATAWYDSNGDGKMQYTELRSLTDSSGTYTTNREYPIGDFDIWLQYHGTSYQTGYAKVSMSGSKNSDGSAKSLDQDVFIRATDDSVTYDGTIGNKVWDDGTDFNYTTTSSGLAEISVVLSTEDKGISSRLWDAVDYKSVYSGLLDRTEYPEDFWLKWDEITDATVEGGQVLAPDFFGIYMTIADKILLSPTVGDFDFYGDDNTDWYGAIVVDSSWGQLIYKSADSSAPTPTLTFNVGTITGAGATDTTHGVCIHTGLTYEQMVSFKWTESATYQLGTAGSDWDWVA